MPNTTVAQAYQRLIRDIPELGEYYAAIDSIAVGSVTVTSLANSNLSAATYENWIIERPSAATAPDRIRFGSTFSAGAISHSGTNYADTTATSETLRLWKKRHIRPETEILNLFTDSLKFCKFKTRIPLLHGPASGDMQGASTTVDGDWTESGGTDTVTTTAGQVMINGQVLTVIDTSGAGTGYTQQAVLANVGTSRSVLFQAIAKSDVGTSAFQVLNAASTQEFSIPFTQEQWLYIKRLHTFSSTTEQFRIRLAETTAAAEGDWQKAGFTYQDNPYFDLPAYFDEDMTPLGLEVANFYQGATETDTWLAGAVHYETLVEGVHYTFERPFGDVNPQGVRILPGYEWLLGKSLWLTVLMPYSKPYGTAPAFSAETDSTDCPIEEFATQNIVLLGERYPEFASYVPRAEAKLIAIRKTQERRQIPELAWAGPSGGRI